MNGHFPEDVLSDGFRRPAAGPAARKPVYEALRAPARRKNGRYRASCALGLNRAATMRRSSVAWPCYAVRMKRLNAERIAILGVGVAVGLVLGGLVYSAGQSRADRRLVTLESCVRLLEQRAGDLEWRVGAAVAGLAEHTAWLPDSQPRETDEALIHAIAVAMATHGSQLSHLVSGAPQLHSEVLEHALAKAGLDKGQQR